MVDNLMGLVMWITNGRACHVDNLMVGLVIWIT